MYTQILIYVLTLFLFNLQQPVENRQVLPPFWQTGLEGTALFILYGVICRRAFQNLRRALEEGWPSSLVSLRYHRLENRFSFVAVGLMGFYIFGLNIKAYLAVLPGLDHSLALSGLTAIGLTMMHQAVIWVFAYPVYKAVQHSRISLTGFIKGHVSFSAAVLVPWLFLALVSDALDLLPLPALLTSEVGQFLLLGITIVLFALFAPPLVVRLWGCESIPPTSLRGELEDFCKEHRFSIKDFKRWPLFGGETLTAGIIGLLPRRRFILITDGLLNLLDTEELKAVVAHEMGHIKRGHLILYLFFFLCFSLLIYSLDDLILLLLLRNQTLLEWALTPHTSHTALFSAVYVVPILVLLIVYFRFVFGFFMRNSERQADIHALQIMGSPLPLVTSLRKIAFRSGQIEDLPNWHHYSIRERIDFLLDSFDNPSLIRRHHRKIYSAFLLFVVAVSALVIGAAQLDHMPLIKTWRYEVEAYRLAREMDARPNDPELHAAYGGVLLELKRFEEAGKTLRHAVELSPNNAGALNNLAWFYATAPPPHANPSRALELAERAAILSQEPHVLDTLAEALYANGLYEEAMEIIDEALRKEPPNRLYFLKQRQKFERAVLSRGEEIQV